MKPKGLFLFNFIVEFKTAHDGCGPTIREIIIAAEYSPTSMDNPATTFWWLRKLEEAGWIRLPRQEGHIRVDGRIEVIGGQWMLVHDPREENVTTTST